MQQQVTTNLGPVPQSDKLRREFTQPQGADAISISQPTTQLQLQQQLQQQQTAAEPQAEKNAKTQRTQIIKYLFFKCGAIYSKVGGLNGLTFTVVL